MGQCQLCKREVELPFTCSYCRQTFCPEHRLPEKHLCPNLPTRKWNKYKSIKSRPVITKKPQPVPSNPSQYNWSAQKQPKNRSEQNRSKKQSNNTTIIILFILIGIAGIIYYEYQPSVDDIKSLFGELNKEIEDGYNELVEVANDSYREIVEVTEAPPPLIDFESIDELVLFLKRDNVSDVIYASDFTCGDFAEALVDRATKAGYNLEVYSMWDSELDDFISYVESVEYTTTQGTTTFSYGEGSGHAVCRVTIDSVQYLIEPQDDMVFEVIHSGYEVCYFGEVTQ